MATIKWDKFNDGLTLYGVAHFYDKKKNIPYRAIVDGRKRGSNIEYTISIQGKVAEPIRGWWMINTFYHKEGSSKSNSYPFTIADNQIKKLGSGFTNISDDEYSDWNEKHPIKKQRKNPTDWGIYGTSPDGKKGWLDLVYGSLLPRNAYASRWSTQAEAKSVLNKLTKNNPGWKFEVKQMGKVEYQK